MIRSIFAERYKKVLIAACLLVIGVSVCTALVQNNQWKELYHAPHAKVNFDQQRDQLTYWDDELGENVPYSSYQEYRNSQLMFYTSYSNKLDASNFSSIITYQSRFSAYLSAALALIVPLIGFLLFFIDQKTGFNQFLFSIGTARKELFKKKMIYLAIPFLLAVLVGQSLYALLIHTLIPAPYMNATLEQLFTSVLSHFSLLFFLFFAGVFIGSMVGNIFFGPLTLGVFLFLMNLLPEAVYSLRYLINLARGAYLESFPTNLFVDSVGKTSGNIWANLILVGLGLLLVLWSYRKYERLSLENDNSYLLHKNSRWPVWCLMTVFTSFVLIMIFFEPWSNFLQRKIFEHVSESIIFPIIKNLSVFLIVACICATIVFFTDIVKKLPKIFNKLTHQTR